MKIALAGPSGVGKTTICKFISTRYNLPYIENSAGKIIKQHEREILEKFGYRDAGHRHVINLSGRHPEFGKAFQDFVFMNRRKIIVETPKFIIDRSPVDNLVYYFTQTSHNCTDKETEQFIAKVVELIDEHLDYLVYIPVTDQPSVEDNGSRIPHLLFQKYISGVFDYVLTRYIYPQIYRTKILTLNSWWYEGRIQLLKHYLDEPTIKTQ